MYQPTRHGKLAMPIHYDLHLWLHRHNPAGRFAMWNPTVSCTDEPGPISASPDHH